MKKMKKILMAGSMFALVNVNAQAAQTAYEESLTSGIPCEEPKDCAEMGYTANAADCIGPALKCPWDLTKAMCEDEAPNLIVYGDGTVTKKILAGKTPVGVVLHEDKRIAIALTNIKEDGTPGIVSFKFSSINANTPLEDCASGKLETCGTDGRANTDILLKQTSGTYYAAQAANKYEPAGCTAAFCKKGKWFLGSFAEMHISYSTDTDNLRKTLYMLRKKGAEVVGDEYWTSTETASSASNIWGMEFGASANIGHGKTDDYYVRPVVKY